VVTLPSTSQGSHVLRGVSRRFRLFAATAREVPDQVSPKRAGVPRRGGQARTTRARATQGTKPEVRVVIADDHPLWRATLRQVLERARGFQIVGEAADGAEAVKVAGEERPDVIVLDMEMPSVHGIDVAREVATSGIGAKILVLSSHDDRDTVLAGRRRGRGRLPSEKLQMRPISARAIRRVAAGEIVFPAAQAEFVLSALRSRATEPAPGEGAVAGGAPPSSLSKREVKCWPSWRRA